MEQKIQGYLHPNIQKPSDEQYFKYKQLVENELGLDWSKEKKYLLHGRLNARLFELGINFLAATWAWWCRAADVVPLWDPYGALFSVVLMVGLCGFCVKRVMDEE